MADQLIGNYKVLKQIGAGGMAKVYLAVHKDIPNLKVILKILTDPRLVQRFKQEADKLALLDGNPNICRIKHFFTHGDDVVIAMEYIDGQSLDEKLKADGKIPIGESVQIVRDVLSILEFAHERGIYHRDIKPSNIMIDSSGTVKIIDFGIAKGESDANLTIAGTACGTPAFMAPEQFTPSEDTNYALVDVYACGVTLYRMLTGMLPFKGDNEFAIRDAKLFTEPAAPRTLASGISRELDKGIMRSIAKTPEERYQSAGEMRKALGTLVGHAPIRSDDATADNLAGPKRPLKSPTKRRLPMIGGTLAVLIAAVASIWYFWLPGGPTPLVPVSLSTPVDNELFTESATPTLAWVESPIEKARYILEYADDSLFSDSRTVAGLATANFTFSADLSNGTYYWRVYTVGSDGRRSDASNWQSFGINMVSLKGQLTVEVDPRGDIYLDDVRRVRGEPLFESEVDTGQHVVRVENRASRQKRFQDTLQFAPGESITKSYRFTFLTTPKPEEGTGQVKIGSRPGGASVYIDGVLQSGTTPYTYQLPPGRHVIRATITLESGQVARADTVRVVAGVSKTVIFDFE